MSKMKTRVKVQKTAKKGEVVLIKTLVTHPMESGRRVDKKSGKAVPRLILNKMVCRFNGEQIFQADQHPGIAANPYLGFTFRAQTSGTFEFLWTDDNGVTYTTSAKMTVS